MTDKVELLPTVRGFAADVGERAAKAFASALLGVVGAGQLNVLHFDWTNGLAVATGAAVVSVLLNVISLPAGHGGTASLTASVIPTSVFTAYKQAAEYGKHAAPVPTPPAVVVAPVAVAEPTPASDAFPADAWAAWLEHPRSKPRTDALVTAVKAWRGEEA